MLGQILEHRVIRDPGWGRWAADAEHSIFARKRVTEDSALQLLAVQTAVKIIAGSISTLPVEVFRGTGRNRSVVNNPPRWVMTPNVDLTQKQFVGQLVVSILLRGNAYALIVRDSMGQPLELWPIHPDWMTVKRATFTSLSTREYFVLGKRVDPKSILHVPGFMMPGALVGVDPITAASDALGLGVNAQEYGGNFFNNSAIPAGVINHPGTVTMTQAKELADSWRSMHGGTRKGSLPAVLTGGATYQPVTVTNEQAQFLETRRYTDDQIYRLFGLGNPLNTDQAGAKITYANVEQISTDVTRYGLQPITEALEEAFTGLLPRPQNWRFNFDAFMRADLSARYAANAVALDPVKGWMEKDEVREREDLPPLTDEQKTAIAAATPPQPEPVPGTSGDTNATP